MRGLSNVTAMATLQEQHLWLVTDITSSPCILGQMCAETLHSRTALAMAMTMSGQMVNEMSSLVGLLSEFTFGKRVMLRKFVFGIFQSLFFSTSIFFFFLIISTLTFFSVIQAGSATWKEEDHTIQTEVLMLDHNSFCFPSLWHSYFNRKAAWSSGIAPEGRERERGEFLGSGPGTIIDRLCDLAKLNGFSVF